MKTIEIETATIALPAPLLARISELAAVLNVTPTEFLTEWLDELLTDSENVLNVVEELWTLEAEKDIPWPEMDALREHWGVATA